MFVIVGDVHGCLVELRTLLDKVGYVPSRDTLVLVGDLIDRGPDPIGVVALAMNHGARIVMGNHEEKALRWLRHEARVAREPGYANPMEPARGVSEARKAEWRALSAAQRTWLAAAPAWIDLGTSVAPACFRAHFTIFSSRSREHPVPTRTMRRRMVSRCVITDLAEAGRERGSGGATLVRSAMGRRRPMWPASWSRARHARHLRLVDDRAAGDGCSPPTSSGTI